MKNLIKLMALALMVTLFLGFTGTIYAGEDPSQDSEIEKELNKVTPRERIEDRLDNLQERQDRFLKVVEIYAPEQVDDFESIFEQHNNVHQELFDTKVSIRNDYKIETLNQANLLKSELMAQVEAKEITLKEAFDEIKAHFQSRKESFDALKEEYRISIQGAVDEWKEKAEAARILREDLKAAIEAENTEEITLILDSLYQFFLEHVEFDQYKLEMLIQ